MRAYASIFARPAFRWFWLGATVSALGDMMTRVALTWFVLETTGSPEALGWLAVAYTAPILVGGLIAGVVLDRFDRRTVLLTDSLVRSAIVALVPLLWALGRLQLWEVYAVAAAYAGLMMLSLAGGPSVVPSLVTSEQLSTANALEMVSFTVSGVVGPLVAGVLIPRIGAPNVVLCDAASYLIFALALTRLPPLRAAQTSTTTGGLAPAWRLLRRNPVLLATTLMFMVFNVGGTGAVAVWLPLLADQVPGGGPELYGALLGAIAVGELAGAAMAGGVRPTLTLGTSICIAQVVAGAALLALLAGAGNVAAIAAGLGVFGLASAPLTAWAQTLRMQVIPADLRGRTFALLRTLMQGSSPVGGALAGVLIPLVGIPLVVALSAALVGGPGLAGLAVRPLRAADPS